MEEIFKIKNCGNFDDIKINTTDIWSKRNSKNWH